MDADGFVGVLIIKGVLLFKVWMLLLASNKPNFLRTGSTIMYAFIMKIYSFLLNQKHKWLPYGQECQSKKHVGGKI